jgi:hypothetical protein
METIPSPTRRPHDLPGTQDHPGDDVREPPLPDNGSKDNFPGKDDLINPEDGGGRIKKGAIET